MPVFERINQQNKQRSKPCEASAQGWLAMAEQRRELPAGYQFLNLINSNDVTPYLPAMRADLVPVCRHVRDGFLCAQLSPMGRVTAYGEWTPDRGWTPWTPHWEAVLVTLWAREALEQDRPDAAFDWIRGYWPAVQDMAPGLPDWQAFSMQSGPGPLMTLLERGVAAYPALLWLSAYADNAPASALPENLPPLLVRERCRLWRTVDPSENSLQQVVKAVYAVQAMRRGEFDCRQPELPAPYALHLPSILQTHWAQVPEPLRDDHLIKAARDGRPEMLAQAWLQEAVECRQRRHYADAFRAMGQAWSADAERIDAAEARRWLSDSRLAESNAWETLMQWHEIGLRPSGQRVDGAVIQQLLLNL